MKQFDLFECQKELDIQAKREQMFQKWRLLPPERLILAGTPDRRRLGEELADGYCWSGNRPFFVARDSRPIRRFG